MEDREFVPVSDTSKALLDMMLKDTKNRNSI